MAWKRPCWTGTRVFTGCTLNHQASQHSVNTGRMDGRTQLAGHEVCRQIRHEIGEGLQGQHQPFPTRDMSKPWRLGGLQAMGSQTPPLEDCGLPKWQLLLWGLTLPTGEQTENTGGETEQLEAPRSLTAGQITPQHTWHSCP